MRKNTFYFVAMAFILFSNINCINSPVAGCLFTNVDHHIYDRSGGSQIGLGQPLKHGKSCSDGIYILNYFYYGDGKNGLSRAMKNAGITKIASIDYTRTSISNYYYRDCVEVYGE